MPLTPTAVTSTRAGSADWRLLVKLSLRHGVARACTIGDADGETIGGKTDVGGEATAETAAGDTCCIKVALLLTGPGRMVYWGDCMRTTAVVTGAATAAVTGAAANAAVAGEDVCCQDFAFTPITSDLRAAGIRWTEVTACWPGNDDSDRRAEYIRWTCTGDSDLCGGLRCTVGGASARVAGRRAD